MAGNRYLVIVLNSEVSRIKILRFSSNKLSVSENKSWSTTRKTPRTCYNIGPAIFSMIKYTIYSKTEAACRHWISHTDSLINSRFKKTALYPSTLISLPLPSSLHFPQRSDHFTHLVKIVYSCKSLIFFNVCRYLCII